MISINQSTCVVLLAVCSFALFQLFTDKTRPEVPENNDKASNVEYSPIVELKSGGQVRGWVQSAEAGRRVNLYQAIRYGRAIRFEKPTPIEAWSGIYNATKPRFVCPQPSQVVFNNDSWDSALDTDVSSEDCLFLNVWQPSEPKARRSVMFWVHGGSFLFGSIFSSAYSAHQIAALGDVVVVAANYRLGPLGFLSAGTEKEPGNLGLYDLILALDWVKQNIGQFGGNPHDVTLFGQSAGAMLVGTLALSPLTVGLFNRAILQSGAPNSFAGSDSRIDTLKKTSQFAQEMQCPVEKASMLQCLRSKSLEQINEVTAGHLHNLVNLFVPNHGGQLLPDPPVQSLKRSRRQLDLMVGVVQNEGTALVELLFPEINMQEIILEGVRPAIRLMLNKMQILNTESIERFYSANLNRDSDQQQLRTVVSNAFGDYYLLCPTLFYGQQMANSLVQNGPSKSNRRVYSYRLLTPIEVPLLRCADWMGVCHGADLAYLFGHPLSCVEQKRYSQAQIQLSRDIIRAWTHFAKTGKPGSVSEVRWQEVKDNKEGFVNYLAIDATGHRMVEQHWEQNCQQIWKKVIWR